MNLQLPPDVLQHKQRKAMQDNNLVNMAFQIYLHRALSPDTAFEQARLFLIEAEKQCGKRFSGNDPSRAD